MESTFIISYNDFGRIKKREHSTKDLMSLARKCMDKYQFVYELMEMTMTEINYEIERAVNPTGYTAFVQETGEPFGVFTMTNSFEELEEKVKQRHPNINVKLVKDKVNYYKKKKYEALKKEYESLLEFYDNLGLFNFYTPIQDLWAGKSEQFIERFPIYALYQKMAKELNIIGYKEERDYHKMDSTWYRSLGLQGNGIEFITADSRSIYLYMDIQDYNHLYISQFAVNERGEGLGTKVMELLKDFMVEIKGEITVMKVCNPKFFDRFDWLVPSEGKLFYEFNSRKLSKVA